VGERGNPRRARGGRRARCCHCWSPPCPPPLPLPPPSRSLPPLTARRFPTAPAAPATSWGGAGPPARGRVATHGRVLFRPFFEGAGPATAPPPPPRGRRPRAQEGGTASGGDTAPPRARRAARGAARRAGGGPRPPPRRHRRARGAARVGGGAAPHPDTVGGRRAVGPGPRVALCPTPWGGEARGWPTWAPLLQQGRPRRPALRRAIRSPRGAFHSCSAQFGWLGGSLLWLARHATHAVGGGTGGGCGCGRAHEPGSCCLPSTFFASTDRPTRTSHWRLRRDTAAPPPVGVVVRACPAMLADASLQPAGALQRAAGGSPALVLVNPSPAR